VGRRTGVTITYASIRALAGRFVVFVVALAGTGKGRAPPRVLRSISTEQEAREIEVVATAGGNGRVMSDSAEGKRRRVGDGGRFRLRSRVDLRLEAVHPVGPRGGPRSTREAALFGKWYQQARPWRIVGPSRPRAVSECSGCGRPLRGAHQRPQTAAQQPVGASPLLCAGRRPSPDGRHGRGFRPDHADDDQTRIETNLRRRARSRPKGHPCRSPRSGAVPAGAGPHLR